MTPEIPALLSRLGVPDDAKHVLLFSESTHWDPNWLHTSEEYYQLRIEKTLDEVLHELEAEPRRIFSIECMFFLQLYWNRRPDRQEQIRALVNTGRLRLSGTGITTPDTLLPDTESILRDYLYGQQWLRENGMHAEPALAYLPDNFGHSPALPSILRSLGFEMAGITRIDGMYFIGSDWARSSKYPLKGSSAELLMKEHKSLDFVWRGPDGQEVLTHWNAFTYFQGDMLAHKGIIRWMGKPLSFSWRTRRHVAKRIHRIVDQLRPLSRTRYLLCPIGCDFNGPIRGLVGLLDRYNASHYEKTGIWAAVATMEDYLHLVADQHVDLPVLSLDPNPYWMGFYATRPKVKQQCNRIAHKLMLAERVGAGHALEHAASGVAITADDAGHGAQLQADVRTAWDMAVVTNHHDFITGTSPDRVFDAEQRPWLAEAEALADQAIVSAHHLSRSPEADPADEPPAWTLSDGRLRIVGDTYEAELSEAQGGCLTSYRRPGGPELLSGPANDLIAYRCSGGLWRMGHEFNGGRFAERARASAAPAQIAAEVTDEGLEVRVTSELMGRPFERRLWFSRRAPDIRGLVTGSASKRLTVTVRFPTQLKGDHLEMDVPGGVFRRPLRKLYNPTFWSARSVVHLRGENGGGGLAAFLGGPATAAVVPDGQGLEWIAFRNAHRERAFGFLPVLAHPARGFDHEEHAFSYGVLFTSPHDTVFNGLLRRSRLLLGEGHPAALQTLTRAAENVVVTDHPDVAVTTVKRADRGVGVIVRLFAPAPAPTRVRLHSPHGPVRRATRCDARERDQEALAVIDGDVELSLGCTIETVRLEF